MVLYNGEPTVVVKILRVISPAIRRRPADHGSRRALMRTLVAATIFLTSTASFLDPRAVERDPGHGHIVVGGSAPERLRALAEHLGRRHLVESGAGSGSFAAADDQTGATAGAEGAARVFSVQSDRAAGALVFGTGGAVLLASPWRLLIIGGPGGPVAPPLSLTYDSVHLPIPEPPPRRFPPA
jgi:hypothetical protein